jgi:hypothetical protein
MDENENYDAKNEEKINTIDRAFQKYFKINFISNVGRYFVARSKIKTTFLAS